MHISWFFGGLLLVLTGLFFMPTWVWTNILLFPCPQNASTCMGCFSNEPVKIEAMIPFSGIFFGVLVIAMAFETNEGEKNG